MASSTFFSIEAKSVRACHRRAAFGERRRPRTRRGHAEPCVRGGGERGQEGRFDAGERHLRAQVGGLHLAQRLPRKALPRRLRREALAVEGGELGPLEAAARVDGLEAAMTASGMAERLAAAGLWCEQNGWVSVAHLRTGGRRAADAFVGAMRLKPDGPRARRLRRALNKDEYAWDAHSQAARQRAPVPA